MISNRIRKKLMLSIGLTILAVFVQAQVLNPVKWSYSAKRVSSTEAVVYFKANMDASWHIYSVNQKDGGPLKTSVKFIASSGYTLVGKIIEPKPLSKFEEVFGMMVYFFDKEVVFQQKLKLKSNQTEVKGKIEYMACTDEKCTPPLEVEFSIPVK